MAEPEGAQVSRQSFSVAYDGKARADDHTIDVNTLAPALLAFGRLLKEGNLAFNGKKATAKVLTDACEQVEDEEDEHLYHSTGWTRELWVQALGMPAVLPPPEEQKNVATAIGAARAKNARDEMQ